ncbi:hypothetical protein GGF43_001858 [Coemansia sp. RSA 2618]|nr:hypothetical protein GGF43_001858 [Coemansia sp. RSA 2618]
MVLPSVRRCTWHALFIILYIHSTRAASANSCSVGNGHALFKRDGQSADTQPISGRKCSADAQCTAFRIKQEGTPSASVAGQPKARLGEYACISGSCRYVVKAGELCFSAHDCAAFQLNRRWETSEQPPVSGNSSSPVKRQALVDHSSGDELAHSWCAPDFCTLESTCGGAWTLSGAPRDAPQGTDSSRPITNNTVSCCRGFLADAQCGVYSGAVDTCAAGYTCATGAAKDNKVEPLSLNTPLGKCVSQEPHQQIWIGVVLVLVGGATLNIGLNLQKYAFRKRKEKIEAEAVLTASANGALSPSKPSKVMFFSSDAVHKPCTSILPKSTSAHDEPVSSPVYPASADHIYSQSRDARQPLTTSASIAKTADAANMRRISLTSHHNAGGSMDTPSPMPQRQWLWKRRVTTKRSRDMPIGNPVWLLGLAIFILGNAVNFIALQFAPQSLVAPLGAVSLVTNVIIAPLLNNEKIGMFDIGGIALIIAGCVIVVVFSGIVQQNFRLCVLVQLLKAKPTVLYLCLIFAAILGIYTFLWTVERGVARYHEEYHQLDDEHSSNGDAAGDALHEVELVEKLPGNSSGARANTASAADTRMSFDVQPWDNSAWTTRDPHQHTRPHYEDIQQFRNNSNSGEYSGQSSSAHLHTPDIDHGKGAIHMRFRRALPRLQLLACYHPLMAFDSYIKPIKPTSRHVRYGLPLAYASLGSFMAALTTLFAKSLVNLLATSLFDHDNQFTNVLSWAILLVTVFTAASQVYWINQGLLRYDALLQVPVFYVVWTVFDIIGGGIYFNEFRMFTTIKYVLFVLGVGVIFSGVGLLANRLKNT